MTADRWRDLRDDLDQRARSGKDSQRAAIELSAAFGRLSRVEQAEVVPVLNEWLLSDDETLRFDAMFVIAEHSVNESVPALRRLEVRLESSTTPGAPYEWAKVNRLIGRLTVAR